MGSPQEEIKFKTDQAPAFVCTKTKKPKKFGSDRTTAKVCLLPGLILKHLEKNFNWKDS